MKAISRVVLFTFIEFLNKGIPFLLLPILSRYLTPEDYGVIATFIVFTSFFAIFIGLSGHGAVDANYFRLAKKRLAKYISNVVFVLLLSFSIILILILFLHHNIEDQFGIPFVWQLVALLVALSQFVTLINLTLWVIEKKPINYGVYQTSQTLLFATLSISAVVALEMSWFGHLAGLAIAASGFGLISIFFLHKRGYLKLKLRKLYIKDFLMFGIPLVPHQLGGWLRTQGDKLLIVSFIGGAATGIFSMGQQLALVMLILITSFNKALYPTLYQILSAQPDIKKKNEVVKKSYQLAFGITLVGVTGFVLTPFVYPYFLGENFQTASLVTQLIIVATVFEAFYYLVVNYIFYAKQTRTLAKITFPVALLHILFCYVLIAILKFDYHAIAYSMILSSFIQFLLVWIFSNRVYPMPWFSCYKKELK